MKYSLSFIFILMLVLGFTFLLVAWTSPPTKSPSSATQSGIAVVELFTSQGCSSCPPADELLRSIAKQAAQENLAVYALSFHVDYWNRLGWKDPFSQAIFSERQRQYAQVWDNSQIYTPQMVVNGKKGFVGSKSSEAWSSIESALEKKAETTVDLRLSSTSESVEATYSVSGNIAAQQLQIALVEKSVETSVQRGENSGRRLHHTHVVRHFITQPLGAAEGTVSLPLPNDLSLDNILVIAYVQDPASGKISGASSHHL